PSCSNADDISLSVMASEPHPARENVLPHHPVRGKTVKRILERRGMILLKQIMPAEGKSIARDKRGHQQPAALRDLAGNEYYQTEGSADEVKAPAIAIGVLAQVERVEVLERCVAASHERPLASGNGYSAAHELSLASYTN